MAIRVKAAFDGLGNGGAAWALFGILFGTLSLSIGGTLSVVFGSLAGVLFFAISIPIFYLSYKHSIYEEKQLCEKFEVNKTKLSKELYWYLDNIYEQFQIDHQLIPEEFNAERFLIYLKEKVINDKQKAGKNGTLNSMLGVLLESESNLLEQFIKVKTSSMNENDWLKSIANAVEHTIKLIPRAKVPISALMIPLFTNVVSTFGAVAGCGAGFFGMLAAVGVFAGLSALPIVGWTILSLAVSMSIIVGVLTIENTINKIYIKQEVSALKEARIAFSDINLSRVVSFQSRDMAKKIDNVSGHELGNNDKLSDLKPRQTARNFKPINASEPLPLLKPDSLSTENNTSPSLG